MFKKFTDTLSGTLDTVKNYGSSMGIGQAGAEGQGGNPAASAASKMTLNLPILGNGSVSAPASTLNSPEQSKRSANPFFGIQSTIEKFTGRGDSNNAVVMATQQRNKNRTGPTLGGAVEVNQSKMTQLHDLEDGEKVSSWHDIDSWDQYKKVSSTGQMRHLESQLEEPQLTDTTKTNGTPKLVRSNTDEIIDQEFKNLTTNLDDVLDIAEYDELGANQKDEKKDDDKKKKKKKNSCLARCIRCIQDNRVKGGCVDPEEMRDIPEENLVLKKVLNIVFLVIGICLFVAVFVVIIYTQYGKRPDSDEDIMTSTLFPDNSTIGFYEYTVPYDMIPYPGDNSRLSVIIQSRLNGLQQSQDDWRY